MNGQWVQTCPAAAAVAPVGASSGGQIRGFGVEGETPLKTRGANCGVPIEVARRKGPAKSLTLAANHQNLDNPSISTTISEKKAWMTFWEGVGSKVFHKFLLREERNLVLCGYRKDPSRDGL